MYLHRTKSIRMIHLKTLIILFQLGHIDVSHIAIKTTVVRANLVEISCVLQQERPRFSVMFIENIEKAVVIKENRSCSTSSILSPVEKCECKGDLHAACNVSVEDYGNTCKQWKCAVPKDHILLYSDTLELCGKDIICANASSNQSLFKWIVNDVPEGPMHRFEIKTYDERNISLILKTFARETNLSIVACSLRKKKEREWNVLHWHENFHDGILETYMSIRSGHVYKHQYGNPNVSIRADERFTMCSDKPTPSLELPVCNAINRKDLGAKHFVGNLSGRFQLEVFYYAAIKEFNILGFRDRINIALTTNTTVTIICEAFGNPSPMVELVTPSNSFTNKSFLQLDIMISFSRTNVAQLTCIASNGFGNDSKSIYVEEEREGNSGSTTITVVICLGSIVLGLLSRVCIYRGRYKLLKILHRKEVHLTSFPGHNNVNNLEEEASHNEKSQGSIPSNNRVLKTRGFCNETYAEYTPRCDQQYSTDDYGTDAHISSSPRALSFGNASQDACRSETSTAQAECVYSIAKEIKQ